MNIFIDHLAAMIIASVALLIIVLVQVRGTQTSADSLINYQVFEEIMNVREYLQRDLENMLTEVQTQAAIDESRYRGSGALLCSGTDSSGHTISFSFPTLNNPDSTNGLVIEVTYDLIKTGNNVQFLSQGVTQTLPIFRLERLVNGVFSGSTTDVITAFRLETLQRGAGFTNFTPINGGCPSDLAKVRFEYKIAANGLDFSAGDQRSTSQTNISRFGATVHLSNWD